MRCDLHIHSNCSDGALSVQEIVNKAVFGRLQCISLTDHDTVVGTALMSELGEAVGLQTIKGIELSTVFDEQEVHILVYNYSLIDSSIYSSIEQINDMRNARNKLIAEKLRQRNMPIDLDGLSSRGSLGRPIIAQEMVRLGYVGSVAEAFDLYLGKGKPCYALSQRLTPQEALEFADRYDGIAVLAHPKNLRMPYAQFDQFLSSLVKSGLQGIESNYFTHTKSEQKYYNKMARKYGLISTGGSDYHDSTHGIMLGSAYFEPNNKTVKSLGLHDK